MTVIAANVATIRQRIAAAAERVGRDPAGITVVAVTKTHPLETVLAGYHAGLRHFGENRAEEGQAKVIGLRRWLENNPDRPHWHFIGHLQSRQAGDVLGYYDLIHSVDSLKLAQRLDRLARRDGLPPVEVLLQCNISGEDTKSGFELAGWPENDQLLAGFVATVKQIAALDKIVIRGLMTIAPIVDQAEAARPFFRNLAALRARLQETLPALDWRHLSMGMTDDFEVAIEEGATLVRIGRAIFGERLKG